MSQLTALSQINEEAHHVKDVKALNRFVLIDHTKPEEDVYGTNHVAGLGQIVTWLQAVPSSLDAHKADVREMAETIALALIAHEDNTGGREGGSVTVVASSRL